MRRLWNRSAGFLFSALFAAAFAATWGACTPKSAPVPQVGVAAASQDAAALRVAVSPEMTVTRMQAALLETARGVCGPHRHPVVVWAKQEAAIGHRLRIDWGSGALDGRLICDEQRVQEVKQSSAFRKLVYVSMKKGAVVVVDPEAFFRETPLRDAGVMSDVGASYVSVDAHELSAFGDSQAVSFLKTLAELSAQLKALIYPVVMELLA